MSTGSRKRRIGFTLLALALAVAAFWFVLRHVDVVTALRALRSADPAWVLAACLVNTGTILIQGERLHQLLQAISHVSRRTAAEAVSLGFAGSVLLPARGGEVVKLHIVGKATRLTSTTLIGIITVENMLNFVGLLLMASVVFVAGGAPAWIRQLTFSGVIALPIVLLLIYRMRQVSLDPQLHPWRAWLQRFANSLHHGFTPLRKPKILSSALLITVVAWCMEFLTTWCTLHAFHISNNFVLVFLVLIGVNVAALLPFTPGQVGVYELAATVILVQAGVEPSNAVMIAIIYHLVHMGPTLLVAVGFLILRQLRPATTV